MEQSVTAAIEDAITKAQQLDPAMIALLIAVAAEVAGNEALLSAAIEYYLARSTQIERLYEALLQTYLFAGFPAAIEALKVAHRCASEHGQSFGTSLHEDYDVEHFSERGSALIARVYGEQHDRLRQRINQLSPELDAWMVIEGYGKVLARPAAISFVERELCAMVALATGGWLPQLRSHMHALAWEGVPYAVILDALVAASTSASSERIASALEVATSVWN
jgi:4-carboxymuconolactone decarboxylase